MAFAARVGDSSTHGGVVLGPGMPTVLIAGLPAARLGDLHVCAIPSLAHVPSPFVAGSVTVLLAGVPLLRSGDACVCGASVAVGAPTVSIG
jgi:uncharacterized Zn-binding protein involved in type VI secretion